MIAGAARELARPVRNVVTRGQGFTLATYRAETRHHVQLAADHGGRLLAYAHESWEMQSRQDDYPLAGFGVTTAMYGKPAILTRVNMVKADRQTSGFMRAPIEMPYMYALESAMDELAVALDMDPIELRRVNDIRESPVDGARFTSRSLMRCYDEAAASFGWSGRDPRPGSMRDGDWLDRLRLRDRMLPDAHGACDRAGDAGRKRGCPGRSGRARFWPGDLYGAGPDRRPRVAA